MPRFRVLTPDASPAHFFGSEVRRAREEAGMSQSELGDLVPCDKATVSRVEAALSAPDEAFARACDVAFPQMGGFFTRFLNDSADWAPAVAPSFRPFAEDEAQASALLVFENMLVPGLLQTADYARAVFASYPGVSEGDIENRVTGRMNRQAILDREHPPALWAVLDELVLYREVGGPEIMAAQFRHLAEMAARPHVTIQILTARVHIGVQGAVNIAEKPGAPAVVYMEDFADGRGRLAADRATVVDLQDRFRYLQCESLSPTGSRELIGRLAEQQWNSGEPAATAAARAALAWKSGEPTA